MYKEGYDASKYAGKCDYQCCKTHTPAFPLKCYESKTTTEWCEPTVLCPKGTGIDTVSAEL